MKATKTDNRTLTARLREYASNPAAFRAELVIDSTPPAALGDVCEAWQAADFAALDPAWRRLAGQQCDVPFTRAFLERPRGHSKTSDLAVVVTWALAFSPKRLTGVAAAADSDQAGLLRTAIEKIVDLNPWLCELLEVRRYSILNRRTKSTLEIISADVASSWGHLVDFIVCDELTHWPKPELWHSLFSASAKRPGCVLVIISNAGVGMGTSWQWQIRESAREGDGWFFHSLDGPQASWISQEALAEQRRLLPPKAYGRLWLNLWQTESGDALDMEDIEACVTLPGPPLRYHRDDKEPHVGALDLGLKNDHAALVVIRLNMAKQRFSLASCQSWAPMVCGGQVRLQDVREVCIEASRRFNLCGIIYDPWQAALMAEELSGEGIRMFEIPFVPKNLDLMATTLLSVFRNRLIDLYREPLLIRDLCRLTIVERQSGFKLQATRDEHGHCDRATALALGLPEAAKLMNSILRASVETPVEEYVYA